MMQIIGRSHLGICETKVEGKRDCEAEKMSLRDHTVDFPCPYHQYKLNMPLNTIAGYVLLLG